MEKYFTKAKPKVIDYNPITHTPFYNQPASPQPRSPPSSKLSLISQNNSSPLGKRFTSIVAQNIFSSRNTPTRSPSSFDIGKEESMRLYKTRVRSKITDPISGEVRVYKIERPRLEALDAYSMKDKLSNDFDYESVKRFSELKSKNKSTDNIAGSLRKDVPFVSYVNPYVLKSTSNS